ncbi:hypothetical protein B0H21DRAFT_882681 [Amylocystis lapponica]|nr:hypothetical protein B0H21DRAFT_882681 [Amylocystis lapponica]
MIMPSICSSSEFQYPSSTESLIDEPMGSHRIKYRGAGDYSTWDFALETDHRPVDVSLVLPHYRARNQPLDHQLHMYIGSPQSESVKVKVCRNFLPTRTTKFHLEVYSPSSTDTTIWLPSDFKGRIHRSATCRKTSFSAGFTNRILQNVCLTQSRRPSVVSMSDRSMHNTDIYISDEEWLYGSEKQGWGTGMGSGEPDEDEVIVHTAGQVTFRMWDIHRGEPETRCKEACKRVFGLGWCSTRTPEVAIDWDFLLDD